MTTYRPTLLEGIQPPIPRDLFLQPPHRPSSPSKTIITSPSALLNHNPHQPMHRRTLTQEADARAISAFLVCLDDTLSFRGDAIPSVPKVAAARTTTTTASHPAHQQHPRPSTQPLTSLVTAQKTTTAAPTQSSQHPPRATPATPAIAAAAAPTAPPPPQSPFPSSSRSRSCSHPATHPLKAKASTPRASLLPHMAAATTTTTEEQEHHRHHPRHERAASRPWPAAGERLASTLAWACLLAVEGEPRHEEFLSAYEAGVGVGVVGQEMTKDAGWEEVAVAGGVGDGLRKGSMPALRLGRKASVGSLRSVFSVESEDSSASASSSASFSSCSSSPPSSSSSLCGRSMGRSRSRSRSLTIEGGRGKGGWDDGRSTRSVDSD